MPSERDAGAHDLTDARVAADPCAPRVTFSIQPRNQEKTWLLASLGALLAAITTIVVWQTHHLLVRPSVLAAIAVPWVALGLLLRLAPATLGFEGKYVDLWSIPHCIGGVMFGLVGVPLAFVLGIATTWEVIEIYARTREYPTNRITDVGLAVIGWLGANLVAGGSFPLV